MKLLTVLLALSLVACGAKPVEEALVEPPPAESAWVKCTYDNCIEREDFEIWIDVSADSSKRFSLFSPEHKLIMQYGILEMAKASANYQILDRKEFSVNVDDKCNKAVNLTLDAEKLIDNWGLCFNDRLGIATRKYRIDDDIITCGVNGCSLRSEKND